MGNKKQENIIYGREIYGRFQNGTTAKVKAVPMVDTHVSLAFVTVLADGHDTTIRQQQPGVWAFTNKETIAVFNSHGQKNLFILPQGTELQILAVGTDNVAAHLENMKQHRPSTPAAKKPAAKKPVKKKPAHAKATPVKKVAAKKK